MPKISKTAWKRQSWHKQLKSAVPILKQLGLVDLMWATNEKRYLNWILTKDVILINSVGRLTCAYKPKASKLSS